MDQGATSARSAPRAREGHAKQLVVATTILASDSVENAMDAVDAAAPRGGASHARVRSKHGASAKSGDAKSEDAAFPDEAMPPPLAPSAKPATLVRDPDF
jgi:hypothetical protein